MKYSFKYFSVPQRRAFLPTLFFLLATTIASGAATRAQTSSSTANIPVAAADSNALAATSAGRLQIFDSVWATVGERYYDANFGGMDWAAMREQFRPQAETADDAAQLYTVLRLMLAQLNDAHTRVYAPEEKFDWQHPRYLTVGVTLREIEGLPLVVAVDKDSPAARSGLRVGDEIVGVDDTPVAELLRRRLALHTTADETHATPATRLRALAMIFDGKPETAARVAWRDARGASHQASLERTWQTHTPALTVKRLPGNISLVSFDLFTPGIAVALTRAFKTELRDARAIILDLRNNGGGETQAMSDIASTFLPPQQRLGRFYDRAGNIAIEPFTSRIMFSGYEATTAFGGTLFVLTSPRTSSAAEILVNALREQKRAVMIGQTTCGCVLAVRRRHPLPDGGLLDISELDFTTPNGKRLEGHGIAPDISVTLTRTDLYNKRDPFIEQAVKMIKGEKAKNNGKAE